MDVTALVKEHYSGDDLAGRVLAAVAGPEPANPTWLQVAGVDQLHAGGLPATRHLLTLLDLSPASRLIDIGCGLGGTARCAAADYGCQVLGVDLSDDFVRAATILSDRVGLGDRVKFTTTTGDLSPIGDNTFDRATLVHVGMNVPDKAALFREVHRVLAPGGRFGLFEQLRVSDGAMEYPLPWAVDEQSSFVGTVDEYIDALLAAGFVVDLVQNRTADVAGPPAGPGPGVVFGPDFGIRIANNMAATAAGILGAVVITVSRS